MSNSVYSHLISFNSINTFTLSKIMVQTPGSWFPTKVQTLSTNQTDSRRTIQCIDLERPLIGTHESPGLRMRMREFH